MNDYPKRKALRLPVYDYSEAGEYFLTICTKDRKPILSSVGRDDLGAPCVTLTNYGTIAEKLLLKIPKAYKNVSLEKYVIMPNHIHLLLRISNAEKDGAPGSLRPTQMVPRIIGALKRLSNQAAGEKLWQTSYYDHVVRNEADYLRIWDYIDTNPAKWQEDEYYE